MRWVVAAGLLLIGCAGPNWSFPPEKSGKEANRDWYECQRDAAMVPPATPVYAQPTIPGQDLQNLGVELARMAQQDWLFEHCLRARGWSQR